MPNVKEVTDKDFKAEVLDFKGVVVVDFWATWCGPCRVLAPIVDEAADEFKDNKAVKFAKADVDDASETAGTYSVRSIPMLVLIKDGVEIDRAIGGKTKAEIKAWVEKALAADEKK